MKYPKAVKLLKYTYRLHTDKIYNERFNFIKFDQNSYSPMLTIECNEWKYNMSDILNININIRHYIFGKEKEIKKAAKYFRFDIPVSFTRDDLLKRIKIMLNRVNPKNNRVNSKNNYSKSKRLAINCRRKKRINI